MNINKYIKSVTVRKLKPIFTKGFELNFHPTEVLILGKNGSGKTSFLRFIDGLLKLNFSEMYSKMSSSSNEREIDLSYEIVLTGCSLKVEYYEKSINKKSNGFIPQDYTEMTNAALESSESKSVKKRIVFESTTPNTYFKLVSEGRIAHFYFNNLHIKTSNHTEISEENSPDIFKILAHFTPMIFQNEFNISEDHKKEFFSSTIEIMLFMKKDDSSIVNERIFSEDNSYFNNANYSMVFYRKFSNQNTGFFWTISPFILDVPTFNIKEDDAKKHDVLVRFNSAISNESSQVTLNFNANEKLNLLVKELEIKDIKINFTLEKKNKLEYGEIETTWKIANLIIVDLEDNEYDAKNLSYGQKRYLGLMVYLLKNKYSPYLIDEPTNGLHHSFVGNFCEFTKDIQLFMTTQSPWILNYLGNVTSEELEQKFIICDKKNQSFIWRNLTKRECNEILKSKKSSILRMDEILKSKEIW